MKKIPLQLLALSSVFILIFALVLLSELSVVRQTIVLHYVTSALLLIYIYILLNLSPTLKKKLWKYGFLLFAGVSVLVLFHALFNGLNIYGRTTVAGHSTLPTFFYTFKIYRIVSLSATSIVTLSLLAVSTVAILTSQIPRISLKPWCWYQLGLLLYGAVLVLAHSQRALALVYKDTFQVMVNTNAAYADRHTYRLGGISYYGWIWPYTQFIIRNTPPTATVAIPPQELPWKMEGNLDYLRWYLHPRKLVKQLPDGTFPPTTEYILITLGDCGEGDCGWPKVPIKKENITSIVLIDRETEVETILTDIEYVPDTTRFKWGIIQLKK